MTRERSRSPFPAAFRVICEIENEQLATIVKEPSEELLEACAHRGKRCYNCRTWDDLAIGWTKFVTICDEDGFQKESWACKLCATERSSLKYTYKSGDLLQAEERPFVSHTKKTQSYKRRKPSP